MINYSAEGFRASDIEQNERPYSPI